MIESQHLDRLPGMNVVGSDDDNIGTVDEVYVDDATGQPSFALVNTGMFGMRSSFVPLDGAQIAGEDLVVVYDKATIKDAPNMDPDGHLEPDDEDELYAHYGLQAPVARESAPSSGTPGPTDTLGAAGTEVPVEERAAGAGTDDAMTRSEEEVHVGTRKKPAGKARLRKHVVTEDVTKTVPVEREEVRVEREPIDESNVDAATDGPAISEDEHEVTLNEEEVVVETRAVPKERVRLEKETHTDEETVEAEAKKEEIDLAGLEESRQDQSGS